ncbi:MAG TPA: lipopolysaccharide transport periplasmic protein LptA [Gammaproteobacteria bacterium]|nr:lipopolysaccharide transport periplasmic protein LptA [Gammaproteobacteria bacterium]
MFTYRPLLRCLITAMLVFPLASSGSDDRDQPVVIQADEVDMDLKSGLRLYRGNVSVTHGSIRILADQIEMTFSNEQLALALATGQPAIFRQRPAGQNHDVVGKGQSIEMDEVNNLVTLRGGASLTQQQDTVYGDTIVYDLRSGKLRVRGNSNSVTQAILAPKTPGGASSVKSSSATTTRARIVVRPDALDRKPVGTAEDSPASSYVIISPSVVYAQPSVDSLAIGQFSPNTPIVVHSRAQDWVRVIPPSGTLQLWVYGKYLTKTGGHSSVQANGIRIRTKPSTDPTSVVVGFLNQGDQVRIIDQRGLWSAIDLPMKVPAWVLAGKIRAAAAPK